MLEYLKSLIEKHAFGVCSYIGEKLGIAAHKVRMYFIYASFFTFGSPVIIYLVLAFCLDFKRMFAKRRSII